MRDRAESLDSRRTALCMSAGGAVLVALGLACGGAVTAERPLSQADEAVVLHPSDLVDRLDLDLDVDDSKVHCGYRRLFGNASVSCRLYGKESWSMEHEVSTFVMESDTERHIGQRMPEQTTLLENEGYQVAPYPKAMTWGDGHDCLLLEVRGSPAGVHCMARKGTRVVTFTVKGVALEGEGAVDDLIGPELAALDTWEPTD